MGTCTGKAGRVLLSGLQRLRCERAKLILIFKKFLNECILFWVKEPRCSVRTTVQFPVVLVTLSS